MFVWVLTSLTVEVGVRMIVPYTVQSLEYILSASSFRGTLRFGVAMSSDQARSV
jgi:hypothetical protein